MSEEEVLQEFIADIEPYIEAIEAGARDARDFADANIEAKAAVDEMRDAAAETGAALGDARDEALTAAEADHVLRDAAIEAAEAMGRLRDEAALAAEAVGAEGAASLGAGAASSAGILSSLSVPAVIALAAALALALAALFPVLAVLPLIGIGFAGLAAIAVPEISKVWQAVSKGGSALKSLSPAERALVEPIRDLKGEFHQLAHAVQPEILKAFGETLKIIRDLMPAIGPLIKAAGQALDVFLGQIDHWLQSGSGQKFIQWMKVDGVGAIKAFGEFLWGLVNVLGRTFSFLFNFGETVHRVFDQVRHDVAAWADDTVQWFGTARHTVASWGHDAASIFDEVRGTIHGFFTDIGSHLVVFSQFWRQHSTEILDIVKAVFAAIVVTVTVAWKVIETVVKAGWALVGPFIIAGLHILRDAWNVAWAVISNVVRTAWQVITEVVSGAVHLVLNIISVALDLLTGHWSQAWSDAKKLTSDALHTIISIIVSLTSGFGHLLWDAGKALIGGLIDGIKSMFGALGSVASSIGGFIANLKGPLPKDLVLLVPHGQAIMHGLMNGLKSQLPALQDLMGAVTGTVGLAGISPAALGGAGRVLAGAGGPAGGTVINLGGITVNGWVGSDQQIALRVQDMLLEHGVLNSTAGIWPLHKGAIR